MTSKIDYYFIGIGGVGMSALANILTETGSRVAGSDNNKNDYTNQFIQKGIHVNLSQEASNITKDIQKIIISGAIPESNEELIRAHDLKIPVFTRSQLLGRLMDEKKGIAITGTHGKTTTTSFISLILKNEGLHPTIANGGDMIETGSNYETGSGEYFVAEACEYKRAFLDLRPYVGVITNIEADHLDYFRDIDDIKGAFLEFVTKIHKEGFLVLCLDSPNLREISECPGIKTFTYALAGSDADFTIDNIEQGEGKQSFEVFKKGQSLGIFELRIPGIHNVLNATAAIATTLELGIRLKTIKETLANFKGTRRRLEIKGERDGVLVIDDYGHHPTELKATLSSIKAFYSGRKIWAVFQPHQHSRTKSLLTDFAKSFSDADEVIIAKIYSVRDTKEDEASVNGQQLSDLIEKNGKSARYIEKSDEIVRYLRDKTSEGDIVISIGAGPVNIITEKFVKPND